MKGYFITLEGGEGSGKSTLIKKLSASFKELGHEVLMTCEPGGSSIGPLIRQILVGKEDYSLSTRAELFLFLANRSQHIEEVIRPALAKGVVVLCDRFNDSTRAYQGAARHFDLDFIQELCDFVADGLKPDLTLFIDIDPEVGLKRVESQRRQESPKGGHDRIEAEGLSFHTKVREGYLRLIKEDPKRIHCIDGLFTPSQVFENSMKIINDTLFKPQSAS
ncbi:MAG: dTMP kinase [Simkaniaceae bacterium]